MRLGGLGRTISPQSTFPLGPVTIHECEGYRRPAIQRFESGLAASTGSLSHLRVFIHTHSQIVSFYIAHLLAKDRQSVICLTDAFNHSLKYTKFEFKKKRFTLISLSKFTLPLYNYVLLSMHN